MNSSANCTKHHQAKLISNISSDGQRESSSTAHQSRTKAVSWIPGYLGTGMREKISSFKRSLLKGKWSQNASTNKFAPRDRRECVAGRIIHVGEGGNELEGMQKMCSAERRPSGMDGEFAEDAAQMPSEASSVQARWRRVSSRVMLDVYTGF